jgi:uncharacterized protein (DUF983 family)
MEKRKGTLMCVLGLKCPQCGEGDLFVERNAYKFSTTGLMNEECARCKEDFQREPGFYFGAAYVSYALTVAVWVAVLVALYVFDALGWMEFGFYSHVPTFLITGISILLVTLPLIYRVSRAGWIALFVKRKKTL